MTRPDNQEELHIDGIRTFAVRTFQSVSTADWTSITVAYPSDVVEVYTYLRGATTIATITVTYSDSTKVRISSVERG